MQKIIGEILFDYVPLVSTANNKIIDAVAAVDFHDVPKDWAAANLYHRLRLKMGLLSDARAQPAS